MPNEKIVEILKAQFIPADFDLQPGTRLLSSGVISSLAMVDLLTALETEFKVSFESDELIPENFDSVQAICELMQRKLV